jgi:hypothetical protein
MYSADDLDQAGLAKYIPSCAYGSIIITGTKHEAVSKLRPFVPIKLAGLDTTRSLDLLIIPKYPTWLVKTGEKLHA